MAATGLTVYPSLGPAGRMSAVAAVALDAHRVLANLMWAYVIGHGAMTVLHQRAGHPVLARMVSLRA